MAGRPKREEEITPVLLRIPPVLLKRVERCQALLQLREGVRLTRTDAFWRILEAGCEALEGRETPLISEISEISSDDLSVLGYGFPEAARATKRMPKHIQVIAETRSQYEKLSLAELSQLLYDRNIYRSRARQSGEEKPVNRGTLQKWLEEAREAGLL